MKTLVTIDSLDGDSAVLDTPAGSLRIWRQLLPAGAKEGDRLQLSLEVDAAETAPAREGIASLRKKLVTGPDDVTEI